MPAGFETINGIYCVIEMLQQKSTFLSVCVNKTVKKIFETPNDIKYLYAFCVHVIKYINYKFILWHILFIHVSE